MGLRARAHLIMRSHKGRAYTTNSITKGGLKGLSCCLPKAIEEAIKAVAETAANTAAGAAPEEPHGLGKPVVIEPDKGESESHNEGAYAAFKEAIEVEDYEASDLEALSFGVNLVYSSSLTFFLTLCQDLLFIVYN